MTDALFDVAALPVEPAPKLTTGQKRRARQDEAVAHGQHPLSVALRVSIRLHPDAGTDGGPTCGGCRWRDPHNGGHASSYPKCWLPDVLGKHSRISHGPGTDVKKAWPACADHEARAER